VTTSSSLASILSLVSFFKRLGYKRSAFYQPINYTLEGHKPSNEERLSILLCYNIHAYVFDSCVLTAQL